MTDDLATLPSVWPRARQSLLVLVIGGLLGAACDQIHVQFQVLVYPHPDVLQQAWWVAPNFGAAALAILLGSSPLVALARQRFAREPSVLDLAAAWIWFLTAYFASGVLQTSPTLLLTLFVTTWLARILPRADRLPLLIHGIVLAFIGSSVEAALSHAQLFHYLHPGVAGVPIWLPGLYLHGSPLAMSIARRLRPLAARSKFLQA